MNQAEIYQMIERRVLDQLENGIIPWRRCYHVSGKNLCVSHQTGHPYSLLNQFILEVPGEYWSFEQIRKNRLKIRKGSKAKQIVFWKLFKPGENCDEEYDDGFNPVIPFLKYYNVFHESDIEGLPPKIEDSVTPEEREMKNSCMIERADNIISNYFERNSDLSIMTAQITPSYHPVNHTIYIPEKCYFDKIEDYYSTVFHEMVHSTQRYVGRERIHGNLGNRAREELVAEIGAAYLCGNAGIKDEDVIKNNSAYCASWLQALKNNIKMLVWASSRAEKAANYILSTEPKDSEE